MRLLSYLDQTHSCKLYFCLSTLFLSLLWVLYSNLIRHDFKHAVTCTISMLFWFFAPSKLCIVMIILTDCQQLPLSFSKDVKQSTRCLQPCTQYPQVPLCIQLVNTAHWKVHHTDLFFFLVV